MKKLSLADRLLRITVRCRSCGGRIRFPLNKGSIRVICPHCRSWFVFSLRPAALLARLKTGMAALFRAPAAGYGTFTGNPAGRSRSPYVKPVMTGLLLAVVLAAAALSICNSRMPHPPGDGPGVKKYAPSALPV